MTDQTTVRLVALADEMQERAIQAELMADKLSRMYGEIQNQLLAVTAERDALKETLKWKHAYWPKRVTELEAERGRLLSERNKAELQADILTRQNSDLRRALQAADAEQDKLREALEDAVEWMEANNLKTPKKARAALGEKS